MIEATRIEAEGCAKTYPGGTRALLATDLVVEEGETLVLLGPSGCGKTTLLRLMSGLDRPDPGGRIIFRHGEKHEDVTDVPIERRGVGMVFQSYALFPNMTVAQNVAYGPKLKGLGRRERAEVAKNYLELCRIEPLAQRRIDQLSGGQRQRVALARALAAEPRAIFLDEPLTALDAALRERLRDEIGALLRRLAITAVYVTHDQSEAMAIADRIVVMSEGRIEQIGTPREVYERPATRFVAEFVGETNRREGEGGTVHLHRPEAVRIVAPGEGIAARVEEIVYLGSASRLTLHTDDGPLRAFDHEGRDFSHGDTVGVVIDEARVMSFRDE